MIDWAMAQRIAGVVAGRSDAPLPGADLAALTADSERRVVSYTGMVPRSPLPVAEGVGRGEWVGANVDGLRRMLDPVLERAVGGLGPLGPAMRIAAGALLTAEVGVLLGLLSQRVLGQYDLVLLEPAERRPPRLLFVMPNLGVAVRAFRADEHELVHWVALHEVTHAVQFSSVPWLQDHLATLLGELLSGLEVRVGAVRNLRLPAGGDLKGLVEAVRRGDLMSLVARPEERRVLQRLQTTMAVVEGHAEHVMDAVGSGVLPSLPRLRAAMERRRRSASWPARLLGRLLGFELKLRQYEEGKRFCDAVARERGTGGLGRLWSSPDSLPSPAELADPALWLARTHVPIATSPSPA